jgi:putative acetyltransferase
MKHNLYTEGLDKEITQLFIQSFTDSEGQAEGEVIGAVVRRFLEHTPASEKRVFITVEGEKVVGGVFFSRLSFEASKINTWLLSPAAVATSMQGQGMGQALIRYAHDHLRKEGVQQVVTYGDINFYSKVGYRAITERLIPAPLPLSYPEGWIAQSLDGSPMLPIIGKSYCVEALNQADLW